MNLEVEIATAKLLSWNDNHLVIETIPCKKEQLTQLELPPTDTPFARILRGKTSDTTIHAQGPTRFIWLAPDIPQTQIK